MRNYTQGGVASFYLCLNTLCLWMSCMGIEPQHLLVQKRKCFSLHDHIKFLVYSCPLEAFQMKAGIKRLLGLSLLFIFLQTL